MTINIGNHTFEGPFTDTTSLKNQSGVYVVLTRGNQADSWTVVDVGEAEKVRNRVETHDRKDCWKRNNKGTLAVAAYYCTAAQRMRIEAELRKQYKPACGVL